MSPMHTVRRHRSGAALALLLLAVAPLRAQAPGSAAAGDTAAGTAAAGNAAARVRWSLVDLVLVPDSRYGVWLLAAPNVNTTTWDQGVEIVQFAVEPVTLLQWASSARRLVSAPDTGMVPDSVHFKVTPRLQSGGGGRFVVLARDMKEPAADERLQLAVVDSASRTRWKTFATAGEVDLLLDTIEEVVARAPVRVTADSTLVADDDSSDFTPAVQLKVPRPRYPRSLLRDAQSGRVWTEYVVGTDGRVEQGSLRVLLADHQDFAREAVNALVRARFRPASRHGTPVRQRVFQPISFRPRS